jgi:hypothetical protein
VKDALAAPDAGGPLYTTSSCGPDVNGDGAVSVADLQTLAGMTAADAPARCDLDGDRRLTRSDFRLLVRAVISAGSKRN